MIQITFTSNATNEEISNHLHALSENLVEFRRGNGTFRVHLMSRKDLYIGQVEIIPDDTLDETIEDVKTVTYGLETPPSRYNSWPKAIDIGILDDESDLDDQPPVSAI